MYLVARFLQGDTETGRELMMGEGEEGVGEAGCRGVEGVGISAVT